MLFFENYFKQTMKKVTNYTQSKAKHIILFGLSLIVFIAIFSCEDGRLYKTDSNEKYIDSLSGKKLTLKKDTLLDLDDSNESDSNELKDILNEFKETYNETVVVDTIMERNGDNVEIYFKHYCILDSAVVIPSKYVSIYGINKFITHNFVSELRVSANNKKLLDTTITTKTFKDYLDSNLQKYGVLLYPNLKYSSAGITIDYSVSIPLTDIGANFSLKIDLFGNLKISSN